MTQMVSLSFSRFNFLSCLCSILLDRATSGRATPPHWSPADFANEPDSILFTFKKLILLIADLLAGSRMREPRKEMLFVDVDKKIPPEVNFTCGNYVILSL